MKFLEDLTTQEITEIIDSFHLLEINYGTLNKPLTKARDIFCEIRLERVKLEVRKKDLRSLGMPPTSYGMMPFIEWYRKLTGKDISEAKEIFYKISKGNWEDLDNLLDFLKS